MIFGNSIKNLFRARGKTALFFVLILILALLVGLDAYVWLSVTQYLDACDQNFTTIGLFEYMGPEYPNERVYADGAEEASETLLSLGVAENENMLRYDVSTHALGFTEGYTRRDRDIYDKNRGVLVIRASVPQGGDLYWGQISKTLYSFEDKTNFVLFVNANGYAELETGHYYLVSGTFFQGPSSYSYFRFGPLRFRDGQTDGPVCIDITDPAAKHGYTIPEDSVFYDIAETARILNNCLDVCATGDVEAQLPFHQSTVWLTDGRFFTDEEYASRAKACIVSEALCEQLSCGVGDMLPLSFMEAKGASSYESFRSESGFASEGAFQIVGVMATPDTMKYCAYIPAGSDPVFANNFVGYTLGTARLKNGGADAFYSELQGSLPDRVRLTVYDQGYAAAEKPFREVLRITNIVSAVCGLAGLCILLLFGFLFVYRQREVSVTMIRLGAGKGRVCAYFLFGAGLLSLLSAAAGAYIGFRLSGRMGAFIARAAASVTLADLRYSNAAQSIVKSLPFTPSSASAPFIVAGAGILLLALLSCLMFTFGAFQQKRARAPRVRVSESAVRRQNADGRAGYALLSIARGGARTIVAPLTAIAAALFLCQLASSMQAYQTEYEQLFANTAVRGYATDTRGKATGSLTINALAVNALLQSGYVEDMALTRSEAYLYEDIAVKDGVPQEITPVRFPETDYAMETFMDQVRMGPKLICTNDLAKAPEFYYSSVMETEFLEGYDERVLAQPVDFDGPYLVLLSKSFMKEKGISLGDTISAWLFINHGWARADVNCEMLVVGSYVKAGVKDNAYTQLYSYISEDMLRAEADTDDYKMLPRYAFESMEFTLKDASKLGEFKDFLENAGFSGLGDTRSQRVYILLEDKTLNDTAETLSRQIRYVGALYPVLYALTGAAGLVAAYLLMLNRRHEYAIMRALGTPKRRVFGTFFFEQLLLCVPGAALGLACARLAGSFSPEGAQLAAGFALCWLLGGAIALIRMNGPAVLAALHEEE